jgi:mannitol/fructose-specific phosphotransferase system IIA component (Ntr-type)
MVVAVGINKEGVDFDALDKKPSRIFVLTLSPVRQEHYHLRFLAEISRRLVDGHTRQQVLEAHNETDIINALCGSM